MVDRPGREPKDTARLVPTAIGATAVLMWSTLALLTTLTGQVPPFQLTAMAFSISSLIGLVYVVRVGDFGGLTRLSGRVWLLGIAGLFGYHFFYFVAMRRAPVVEASLIAYLWPLLIVLLSSLLLGEKLRCYHVVGALSGFAGAALLIAGGGGVEFEWRYAPGYLAALVCALTWSTYSVLSRKWGASPTTAVAGFCLATAALAWICHGLLEETIWPIGWQWGAVLALGLGPVGLAFFVWDWGVKRGSIQALGAISYLAPLLSTVLLILAGRAEPSLSLGVAIALIVGGAVLASRDIFRRDPATDS